MSKDKTIEGTLGWFVKKDGVTFGIISSDFVNTEIYETMNYCEFIKCSYGEARYDLGGCGIAWSGETCYSLYPKMDKPQIKLIAFEIHLEETRLNNE